jgi:drug/metabolite transporter (DMT)-like permease
MKSSAVPSRASIISAFAAIYLIWGSTFLGIRVAVETFPPFIMAGLRFAVAGIILLIFLLLRGEKWPRPKQWGDQAVSGIFLLLGGNAVVSWAELRTPSGIACLTIGASPLFLVLMDWVRPGGKRPNGAAIVGVIVGIAGMALLLGPGAIPAGYRPPGIDIIALFFSSICWCGGSLYSKHAGRSTPLLMAVAMQMICGCVAILLTGLILGEGNSFHISAVSPRSWIAFSYLVVAGSVVAFPVYAWLLEHCAVSKVSTYAFVNPVVAVFLGWAILNEPMNLRILVAASIIVGAVAIITVGRAREPAKA